MVNIIVVDDEANWLEIMSSILKSTFPDLILFTFSTPEEALEQVKNDNEKIDFVFSDYLIPGHMNGLDLYYKLQEEKKGLKFILISNSKIPVNKIKEIVQKNIIYLPKSFLVVKNFVKNHLKEILLS